MGKNYDKLLVTIPAYFKIGGPILRENSEHPLIYDDANINFISNSASAMALGGLRHQPHQATATSTASPTASYSTNTTYLHNLVNVHPSHQVCVCSGVQI